MKLISAKELKDQIDSKVDEKIKEDFKIDYYTEQDIEERILKTAEQLGYYCIFSYNLSEEKLSVIPDDIIDKLKNLGYCVEFVTRRDYGAGRLLKYYRVSWYGKDKVL